MDKQFLCASAAQLICRLLVGFYGNRESSQHISRFARLENRANIIFVYKFYCYQKGKFF